MSSAHPTPDERTWNGRADGESIRAWFEVVRAEQGGPAFRALRELWDEHAAPVLRDYLDDPDPLVAELAIRALGGCGSVEEDGLRLLSLARAGSPPPVLGALLDTLTELEVPEVIPMLHDMRAQVQVGSREEGQLLNRLIWLRDSSVAERLMELVRGDAVRFPGVDPIEGILRVGTSSHRGELVDIAVTAARRVIATEERPVFAWYGRDRDHQRWLRFESAATASGAPELAEAYRRIDSSPEALARGVVLTPSRAPKRAVERFPDRHVPTTWLRPADRPAEGHWPPPKLLGQPDWRDKPAWPLTGDGEPMMFYGQLPLPDGRTAYVFLAIDGEEWKPLGGGNAVVVQPGNTCHTPTVELVEGPQEQTWSPATGFRSRSRAVPHPERFVDLVPSVDPSSWESAEESPWATTDASTWDKLGGTPRWLQAEEYPPGDGWTLVAQFGAASLATERGDGAVCYLWQNADGQAAFGWQCA